MTSKYRDIVDAVIDGNTIEVPPGSGVTMSGLRTSIWRELSALKKQEAQLGITTELQKKQVSIKITDEGSYIVKLILPQSKSVSFKILSAGESDDA